MQNQAKVLFLLFSDSSYLKRDLLSLDYEYVKIFRQYDKRN